MLQKFGRYENMKQNINNYVICCFYYFTEVKLPGEIIKINTKKNLALSCYSTANKKYRPQKMYLQKKGPIALRG